MAYDDFASGKRAMDAYHFLVSQLGGGAELRSSMWKFDVLRSTKLNQIAVDDAIEADVIIVANARNGGLPDSVKTWITGWVPRKRGQAAALMALVDFTGEDVQAAVLAHSLLKDAAAEAKIDFLPQEIPFPESSLPPVSGAQPTESPREAVILPYNRTPILEGWGIND
jgi:hypothetical protein